MPTRPAFEGVNAEALEHLRIGTRDQYESEWRQIDASRAHTFTHSLGEIPWIVDVLRSDSSDGKGAVVAASFTVAKTDTSITITNSDSALHYFKVRAM